MKNFVTAVMVMFFLLGVTSAAFSGSGCPLNARGEEMEFPCIGNQVVCPVRGTTFVPTADSEKVEHDGKIYIFCCPECKPEFEKNPEKYIGVPAGAAEHKHDHH